MTDGREETFRRLYAAHFDAVLGFAVRRTERPEDAADVTADTFLVAWRRLAHVPAGQEQRPWLYGVARRVLANHRRGDRRRTHLGERLRRELAAAMPDVSDGVVQRADVTTAMRRLSARDQEVLELHLGEGLEPREIAEVLGLTGPAPESTPPVASVPEPGSFRAILDAPGWTLESAYESASYHSGEVDYVRGAASLQVHWYPASNYEDRFEDRRQITDPPSDGTIVDLLGLPSSMWAYSAEDHTTIRPVEERHFLEVRGSGMGQEEYLDLLSQLRLVNVADFDAALPDGSVAQSERADAIGTILDEIAATAGRALPQGVSRSSITSDQSDPYHLGAEVTGQVACAWVGQYVEARGSGDQELAQQAAEVMATSRDWPVLDRMDRTGDWPESIWELGDRMAADGAPGDYAGWCDSSD